jgi:hypothetical protein
MYPLLYNVQHHCTVCTDSLLVYNLKICTSLPVYNVQLYSMPCFLIMYSNALSFCLLVYRTTVCVSLILYHTIVRVWVPLSMYIYIVVSKCVQLTVFIFFLVFTTAFSILLLAYTTAVSPYQCSTIQHLNIPLPV